LSDEQKELCHYDQMAEHIKTKNIKNLKEGLQSAGITMPVGRLMHLADLQALVQAIAQSVNHC